MPTTSDAGPAVESDATPPIESGATPPWAKAAGPGSYPPGDVVPWAVDSKELAKRLEVVPDRGLTEAQARRRRRKFGPNRLREGKRQSGWRILVRQFQSLIMLLLLTAAGAALAFGQASEAVAIAAVILINTIIGFVMELQAVRSMEALKQLGRVETRVRRGGTVRELPALELVPGDIVVIDAGSVVPADLRILSGSKLQADESMLTGESVPVGKNSDPVDPDTELPQRSGMLFRGAAVTRGSGEGIVVATGMNTELGRIAGMVAEAESESTPLEKRLDRLGARLVWVTLATTVVVTISGVLAGKPLLLMIETGIALAVATVPEGLPIVATVALARGMWRMARRSALVNRLSAVETLGSTTVICTDKTGTLTQNRMTATQLRVEGRTFDLATPGGSTDGSLACAGEDRSSWDAAALRSALETAVLCNDATLSTEDGQRDGGDPTEIALLRAGQEFGIEREALLERMPELREEPFLPETKKMATFHGQGQGVRVAVKGAPEEVLAVCSRLSTSEGEIKLDDETRARWETTNTQMAGEGLRVLALATRTAETAGTEPYQDLVFLGLVGLLDPPRHDARESLEACRRAGIRVVMVTGDQAATAAATGKALGLSPGADPAVVLGADLVSPEHRSADDLQRILNATILARVSPQQKLDLIDAHQKAGDIVAMTGDGVNDAPALKKADIGIAMGKRGTQVAAQAADMVLRDDSLATIVAAIRQGRIIFENIRRFVLYLLSCNLSEVMVVAIASLAQMPLPILPLQILFLNLVTDVFPALALGVGEGDGNIMVRPPRDPRAPILTGANWLAIGGYSIVLTVSVFAALVLAQSWLRLAQSAAVTLSFLTLAFAQIWHVFNMGDPRSSLLRSDVVRNPWVWGAVVLCTALLMTALYVPWLAVFLGLVPPDARGWTLVTILSLLPLVAGRIVALARRSMKLAT